MCRGKHCEKSAAPLHHVNEGLPTLTWPLCLACSPSLLFSLRIFIFLVWTANMWLLRAKICMCVKRRGRGENNLETRSKSSPNGELQRGTISILRSSSLPHAVLSWLVHRASLQAVLRWGLSKVSACSNVLRSHKYGIHCTAASISCISRIWVKLQMVVHVMNQNREKEM